MTTTAPRRHHASRNDAGHHSRDPQNGRSRDPNNSRSPGRSRARGKPGHSARERASVRTAFLMLMPSFVGVGIFLILPVLAVVVISLLQWNLISPPTFVGLANYRAALAAPGLWNSVKVTVIFSLIAIPGAIISGLLVAVGLNRRLPGSSILQVMYVIPWVAAPLALGVVWNWLLAPSGLVNAALGTRIAWLADERTALPVVALVYIWQNVGYISLFFLAALQTIPQEVYDAARLDGAGGARLLRCITIPLIRPTTFFVAVTSLISSFQVFDLVYGLTGGNPGYPGGTTDVIAARIYTAAFASPRIGEAAAVAVLLTVVIVAITLAQRRYFAARTTYELSAG